jgi:hypothetical protein
MENIFNKEYVERIMKPFEGKSFRMRTESIDKKVKIPFFLETSIESTFQIELTNLGIKFLLKDNFYIKKDLKEVFNKALKSLEIYPFSLDKLLKEKPNEDCVVVNKIVEYFEKNFNPQIAITYYGTIESIRVSEKSFVLNNIEFIIY